MGIRNIILTICLKQEHLDAGVVGRMKICASSGLRIKVREGYKGRLKSFPFLRVGLFGSERPRYDRRVELVPRAMYQALRCGL